MNRIINFCLFLAIGLALGLGSAWFMISGETRLTGTNQGPWRAWTAIGSEAADPYTRAHVAISGRLPVMSRSALYFHTRTDSAGRALDAECTYRIEGTGPEALWWSLTAYDINGELMANPTARYAFNAIEVLRDARGRYTITMSRDPQPGNWLPLNTDFRAQLVLRIYQPKTLDFAAQATGTPGNAANPDAAITSPRRSAPRLALPTIERLDC